MDTRSSQQFLGSYDDTQLERLGWWLVLAGSVVRLLFAALYPMNLAGDEAYYWEWSRRLDWGYFSKPPGIAWLMALVTGLGGAHTVTFRIAAAILGIGSLLLVRALAKHIFGPRAAVIGVLLALATPANVLLSFMLTIDAPLVLSWSAALWCFWRWLQSEDSEGKTSARWLIGLSLALAAGYLSKQMMLVFPALAIAYLALSPAHRSRLRSPGFWIAIGLSFLALVPPLWWNSRNDWITFHHTGGQIAGDSDDRVFGVTFLEFFLTQAGVLSPVTWFFVLATAFVGLRQFRNLSDGERFLVIFSAPAVAVMFGMALRQTMLPNWAAVYYVAALVLVAGWIADRAPSLRSIPASWRRATVPGLVIGFLFVTAGYLLPPILEATGNAGNRKLDPMRRLRGHQEFADAVAALHRTVPSPEKTLVIALDHRYYTSHLAFYLPDQPRVYRWERYDQIASQYELWPNPIEDGWTGWDALVIMPSEKKKVTRRFEGAFESFELIDEVEVPVSESYQRYFRAYLGKNLLSWPPGMPQNPAPTSSSPSPEPTLNHP